MTPLRARIVEAEQIEQARERLWTAIHAYADNRAEPSVSQALDDLIEATALAAALRELAQYRPQHQDECRALLCANCGEYRNEAGQHAPYRGYVQRCMRWEPARCSCGSRSSPS